MNIDKLVQSLPSRSEAERREMRKRAEDWIASGDPVKGAPGQQMLDALDAADAVDRAERVSGPLSDRVTNAFRHRPWTDHERKLIQVLLDNPGSTTTDLNRAAGLGDNMVWQMHFGNMCKDRADYLGTPPPAVTREGWFWSGLLADATAETNLFTMKPEVVEGLARLGLKATR